MNIYQRTVDGKLIYEIFDETDRLRGTCFSEEDALIMRLRLECAEERFNSLILAVTIIDKDAQK
jgi:hypothetical protein